MNRRLTIEARDGEITDERMIGSADELRKVLDETFKVTPPAPVDEVFARLAKTTA
jgi:N-hydroxyarylamine O-acetyltransferase